MYFSKDTMKTIVLPVFQLSVMLLLFPALLMYLFLRKFRVRMYSTEDSTDTDETAVAK